MLTARNNGGYFVTSVTVATNFYDFVAVRTFTLLFAHIVYVSNGTAGQRWVRCGLRDASGNLVMDTHSGAKQTAGNSYHYHFMSGTSRETSFTDGEIIVPFSIGLTVPAGYQLTFGDSANIDLLDTMSIDFQGVE